MKKEIFAKSAKKIFAFALAAALAAPTAVTVNVLSTAAATVDVSEKLKAYDFEDELDALIETGEAEIVNSETIYVVKTEADLAEGEKLDANGLVYTGEGANAKYVTVDPIGSPKIIEDEERGKVLQFDTTVQSVDGYMKVVSSNTENMDETTAKTLDFQIPVNDYFYVESGTGRGKPIKTQSVSAELKVNNPFGGLQDEFKEYNELDDVDVVKYGTQYSPKWGKGITISYWIKVPVDENGAYKNASVLRWENDNTYYFQADDYAKYLPAKLFDQQYSKMSDEEKDKAKKASPSGVYRYGRAEDGKTFLDPDGLMDFYFEYEPGYYKKDEKGYVVADNLYTDAMGLTGPVYNWALINEMQAAYSGKTNYTGTARFYFANPNYVDGFFPAADGSFISTIRATVTAVYDSYHTTPIVINSSGESVQPESSYIKLRNPDEKIDAGDSMIRYALVDSELQVDADDSIFWVLDDCKGINENVNVKASVGIMAGMQNSDAFFMNSWQESSTTDDFENGLYSSAVCAAVSPVTKEGNNGYNIKNGNAGEWHHVTLTMQNDWVEFYVDGECVNVNETYSSRGRSTLGLKNSFQRFNKGAGMRYGFGSEKDMGTIMNGNYVCRLLMDWLGDEDTRLCIGGIGNYAENYAQATTTSEVCLDDVQFYNAVLTDEQIKAVYSGENGDASEPDGDVSGEGGNTSGGTGVYGEYEEMTKCTFVPKMTVEEGVATVTLSLNGDCSFFDFGLMYDADTMEYAGYNLTDDFRMVFGREAQGISADRVLSDKSYVTIAGTADYFTFNGEALVIKFNIKGDEATPIKMNKDSKYIHDSYIAAGAKGTIEEFLASDMAPTDAPNVVEVTPPVTDPVDPDEGGNVSGPSGDVSGEGGNTSGSSADVSDDAVFLAGDVDCNNTVNLDDAKIILQIAVGINLKNPVTEQGQKNADYDKSGKVDLKDATYTLKAAVGIKFTLPNP